MKCTSCDVVEDLTDINKVCKIYMARNKPVLLKGAAREWTAAKKWTLDFFREDRFSTVNVNVSLDGKEAGPKKQMSVKDYVNSFASDGVEEGGSESAAKEESEKPTGDAAPCPSKEGEDGPGPATAETGGEEAEKTQQKTEADGERAETDERTPGEGGEGGERKSRAFVPYMRAWFFNDDCPDLSDDFPNPSACFPDKFKGVGKEFQPPFTWIFIGPQGAYSPLHRDIWFTCAWMAQFEGRKRFVFFSPKDTSHIYRKAGGKEMYCDINNPHPEIFPTFDQASPFEAILEPGDLLYIPSKWAHYVECLTPCVSLTSNFANVANFKHVLVPYTRWLERRRIAIEMMKKMFLAAKGGGGGGDKGETVPIEGGEDLRAEGELGLGEAEEPEEEEDSD